LQSGIRTTTVAMFDEKCKNDEGEPMFA
jgi:hypothetical protein